MANRGLCVRSMPYVPGRARGPLRPASAEDLEGAIAVVQQRGIPPFDAKPAGIIVVDGAPLSHAMIAVLGLGVPTVIIGAKHARALQEGTMVSVDGATGIVASEAAEAEGCGAPSPAIPPPGILVLTADGAAVQLRASVRDAAGARLAVARGAAGIGLVRTEFLTPADGNRPDAEFYVSALGAICEAAGPLPVTVRLLDLAPDKRPSWLPSIEGMGAALGLQGPRLFTTEAVSVVLEAQLDALGCLSGGHDLRVLIPFLTHYEELLHWRERIQSHLPQPLPIGAMIETPSGALDMARWLKATDFIAVGCNDLMQCLFAADRDQPALRYFLDPYAPVLFRLLRQMADAAGNQLQKVQLCGLLPQLPGVLPLLLGLGYRVFSVEAPAIPHLARTVTETPIAAASGLVDGVCAAATSRQVMELLSLPGYFSNEPWATGCTR